MVMTACQRVVLERLLESGFRFKNAELVSANREIVSPAGEKTAVSEWANMGPKS